MGISAWPIRPLGSVSRSLSSTRESVAVDGDRRGGVADAEVGERLAGFHPQDARKGPVQGLPPREVARASPADSEAWRE